MWWALHPLVKRKLRGRQTGRVHGLADDGDLARTGVAGPAGYVLMEAPAAYGPAQ